jgi:AcrR family transcriptional regulator
MPKRRAAPIAPRKQPKQDRSRRLVEHILAGAVRVLTREGAAAFTTIRVAEAAGVSVGSLYQYFPNKESILVRLQEEEWASTGRMLEGILGDRRRSAAVRLRAAMRAFFRSECDEAPLRRALGSAGPLYRETAHAREQRERGMPILHALLDEAAPGLPRRRRAFAADLYIATMASLGAQISETVRGRREVDEWADAAAEMFIAWLAGC